MNLDRELQFVLQTLNDAREVAFKHFQTGFQVELKADSSPVTVADREIESFIRGRITEHFPDQGILGEEEGETVQGDWRWVIDPIDGTKSFVCGVPLFATLLSLELHGEPVVAGVALPALGETFHAVKGGGAFRNGKEIQVDNQTPLSRATICHGSFRSLKKYGRMQGIEKLGEQAPVLRTWGDAYGYCLVASGQTHAMIDPMIAHYDISAPSLLVKEAGGVWSDFGGVDQLTTESIATTPSLQQAILEAFA